MRARSFATVLDDALREMPPTSHWHGAAAPNPRPDPFIYFSLPRFERRGPSAPARAAAPADAPRRPAPAARALTAEQSRALDALNALGAALSSDFTLDQLRRRYRWLAMQLHPDRHPGCSDTERRHLALLFGDATRNYRRLLAVVEPRH